MRDHRLINTDGWAVVDAIDNKTLLSNVFLKCNDARQWRDYYFGKEHAVVKKFHVLEIG